MKQLYYNRILWYLGLICVTIGFFALQTGMAYGQGFNSGPGGNDFGGNINTFDPNFVTGNANTGPAPLDSSFAETGTADVASAASQASTQRAAQEIADSGCDWMCQVGSFLGNMLLSVGGLVAFMGGSLLDLAITNLILGMGTWLTEGGIGLVIDNTWGIVRDVVNLLFIFGFVYIGIRTIIDPGRANTRGLLAQLLIAALLINFSLFFTKIVIDVANVFALEVNELMDRGEGGNIGATFASEMGLSSMYRSQHPDELADLTAGGSITFFLMGTIFLIITGFVFAAGAIMIVIRFVALIFIMIGSPIFFAAMAFPQAKKFTFGILGKLFGYAFYAPVFLFLIYISLRVVQSTTFGGGDNQFIDAMRADGPKDLDQWAIFLQFAVAIVLIIFALRAAKSFSMVGAENAVNLAGAATFGLIGRGLQSTVGRASLAASQSDRLKEAASKRGARGFMARRTLNLSRAGADATYDARNIGQVQKVLTTNAGLKSGFKTARENVEKSRIKFGESLGDVKDTDKKVAQWQQKIDSETDTIQDLKDLIGTERDPDKKAELQGQLRYREFMLKNHQEALKYEKSRRQVGSADANNVMSNVSAREQQQLAQQFIEVATARTAAEKTTARNTLRTMIDSTREQQKKNNTTPMKERGYAGVLENSLGSQALNILRDGHIIPAGKALRKKVEGRFKRTKEDERTERMVDSFKSSK